MPPHLPRIRLAGLLLAAVLAAPTEGLRAQGGSASALSDPQSSAVSDIRRRMDALKRRSGAVRVGDPWTPENRQKELHMQRESALWKVIGTILYESPLPVNALTESSDDPFSAEDAARIANGCKAAQTDVWNQIGCVSNAVNKFFTESKLFANGPHSGRRSFCRSHANAFNVVFTALGIKRSFAKTIDASGGLGEGHVVSLFIVNTDGGTFAYAVDSGNLPGIIFPENDAAIRHHSRGTPGATDVFDLLPIRPDAELQFSPAPKR